MPKRESKREPRETILRQSGLSEHVVFPMVLITFLARGGPGGSPGESKGSLDATLGVTCGHLGGM